jgi:hypothetical protein
MLPLYGWKIKADQFDQVPIERVLQHDEDVLDILPGIRYLLGFFELHVRSP